MPYTLTKDLFELVPHDFHVVVGDPDGVSSAFLSGKSWVKIVRFQRSFFGVTMTIGDQGHECRRDAPDVPVPSIDHPAKLPYGKRTRVKGKTPGNTPDVTPTVYRP